MSINVSNAVAAYARNGSTVGGGGGGNGIGPRSSDPGKSFADLVGEAARNAIDAGQKSEKLTAMGIAGKADLTEVVTAVTNAEITLKTVLSIRDRVIQAYQEIARMPI
jgi:flagellar hook-basal body complex protein FliE